jgi:hypothetical protein
MPDHQQLSILRQVTAEHRDGEAEHPARQQYTILSSTWQASYHLVKSAGESAGQSFTGVFERYKALDGLEHVLRNAGAGLRLVASDVERVMGLCAPEQAKRFL